MRWRQAVAARDWRRVTACALEIRQRAPREAEAPFLLGLAEKAAGQRQSAADFFRSALELDGSRYDAAIELAYQDIFLNCHAEARDLLDRYRPRIKNSARYLDLAAQGYSMMSMHEEAWPLYEKARRLQPQTEVFQAHLAACAVTGYSGNRIRESGGRTRGIYVYFNAPRDRLNKEGAGLAA